MALYLELPVAEEGLHQTCSFIKVWVIPEMEVLGGCLGSWHSQQTLMGLDPPQLGSGMSTRLPKHCLGLFMKRILCCSEVLILQRDSHLQGAVLVGGIPRL